MLDIILIGTLFVLVGVTGLQFSYMFYVERIDRERKKHLKEVERRSKYLSLKLEAAEAQIAEQRAMLVRLVPEYAAYDDAWAEIIDDR